MKTYIYILKDPETDEIRYVGKTVDIKRRYYHHCSKSACKSQKSHRSSWVLSLLERKLKPIMEIIDYCNYENWEQYESKWIEYYTKQGCNLCNHTKGGSGILGCKRSEETKNKISLNNARANFINKITYQFSLEGELINIFDNPTIAAKNTEINIKYILRSCNKQYIRGGNYIWSYDIDGFRSIPLNHNIKTVLQFNLHGDFIQEYESVTQAANLTNIQRNSIKNCCHGKQKRAGKYKWKFK